MTSKQLTSEVFHSSIMRAFIASRFGLPRTVLSLEKNKPIPSPEPNRIQIRVHSAGVHAGDWRLVRGDPHIIRFMFGHPGVPGCEISGVVTAVGKDVSNFRPGDRVLADASEGGFGAFADFVSVLEPHVAKIPECVSYEKASATVVSALAALQAVEKVGGLTKEDRILVTGASGGVGHFVVQMARHVGAHVTAVCRESKAAAVLELGANKVITSDELERTAAVRIPKDENKPFTAVIDTACYIAPCNIIRNLLPSNGRYILVGGSTVFLFRTAVFSRVMQWRLNAKVGVLVSKPNANDLGKVVGMLERGEIEPRIDRKFKFEETVDAIEFVESRKVIGKVVIDFERDGESDLE